MKRQKKGVSPVVSTVLLIMIVVILAIIILIWATSMVGEAITKDIGGKKKSAEQYCQEIDIEPEISADGTSFGFINKGSVPIYKYELKLTPKGGGKSETKLIDSTEGGAVNPGLKSIVHPDTIGLLNYNDYESIKVVPIILGTSEKSGGNREFTCPDTYAKKL